MKRKNQIITLTVILLILTATILAQAPQRRGPGRDGTGRSGPGARGGQLGLISALPSEDLSEDEISALAGMREEEKLARDVYLALYEKWELPIFWNIASSEQRHMDAVGALLEKYELEDVAQPNAGEFSPSLQELYNELLTAGLASEENALYVGATIEDMDIADLREWLSLVDNKDIRIVFNNLLQGSMNHLQAFTRLLTEDYQAQYLTQEEVDEIIATPRGWGRHGMRGRNYEGAPRNGECLRRGGLGN